MSSPSLASIFGEELDALIEKYRGEGLTYGETIGALECAKAFLVNEMMNNDDK